MKRECQRLSRLKAQKLVVAELLRTTDVQKNPQKQTLSDTERDVLGYSGTSPELSQFYTSLISSLFCHVNFGFSALFNNREEGKD